MFLLPCLILKIAWKWMGKISKDWLNVGVKPPWSDL